MIQCTQIYVNAFIWNALAVSESDHAGGSCLRCQPRDNGSGLSDQPWKNDYCSLRKIRLIKRSVNVAPSTPWSPFVIVRTGRFAAIVRKFDDRAVWREWYFRTEPWRGIYIYWLVVAGKKTRLFLSSFHLFLLYFENYVDPWTRTIIHNSLSFSRLKLIQILMPRNTDLEYK